MTAAANVQRRLIGPPSDVRSAGADPEHGEDPASAEWLVTNGLGGYASGTVPGLITRRFHGLLIAALPAPLGRTMMLNYLRELVHLPGGQTLALGAQEEPEGSASPTALARLVEFRLEAGLPVWQYALPGATLEKRLLMVHGQNTVHVCYRLEGNPPEGVILLELEPWVNFRPHEGALDRPITDHFALTVMGDRYEIASAAPLPPLRLQFHAPRARFAIEGKPLRNIHYRVEKSRGYDAVGDLYSPGYFRVDLVPSTDITLVASTEPWEVIQALSPADARLAERKRRNRLLLAARPEVRDDVAAELVLAADQFLITPTGRVEDATRSRAAGDEVRTVIAGYHWFTDWGRDTMISLEGLTLVTGRHIEAGYILRTFGHYVKDGLIPNMFPEGNNAGLYHTADATLWFFHAVDRYARVTGDRTTVRQLLPVLEGVARAHLAGTHYGIRVDPADGLLAQGAEGYQLTWMDAKMGDWVVTPRRGKAVEVNALWHNALCVLAHWVGEERDAEAAAPYAEAAARARDSFNRRFWHEAGQHLYDVVDGPDGDSAEFRPNQLLAISLPNPVLDRARWEAVVRACEERLVTPAGLRSLAPGSAGYRPRYAGDLRSRDGAYHQGTVWAWLIGPWVDAWRKVHPGDDAGARRWLGGLLDHLGDFGVGSVAEVFDAEAPFTPRGCVAQAWSVAEVLRVFAETAGPPGGAPAAA